MAPCKPTNLNKRAYPGNGSVIGPTTQPTCCPTSTTCNSFVSTLCGSLTINWTLGCRNQPTFCPCCQCCCCCTCTVCDRTIPSGMWKSSEQWDAKKRDAWGPDTCSNTAPTGYTTNNGTISGSSIDCYGFLICNAGPTSKWFVAPSNTELSTTWYSRCDAASTPYSCYPDPSDGTGWFIPSCSQFLNPGVTCLSYWDSYAATRNWSDTEVDGSNAWVVFLPGGTTVSCSKSCTSYARAFRVSFCN